MNIFQHCRPSQFAGGFGVPAFISAEFFDLFGLEDFSASCQVESFKGQNPEHQVMVDIQVFFVN